MAGSSPVGVNEGFTPDSTWNNFFNQTPEVAPVVSAPAPVNPVATNLAPQTPQSAAALLPYAPPMSANQYLDDAVSSSEAWLSDRENGTTAVTGRYGSGFATRRPKYMDALAKLGEPIDDTLDFLD